jgi:hypothetical protein
MARSLLGKSWGQRAKGEEGKREFMGWESFSPFSLFPFI